MPTQRTYDLKAVDLVIGGVVIDGFGPDDAIEFEWASEIGESTVGADGSPVFSRYNDQRLMCRITLLETTQGYRNLAALMAAQAAQEAIQPLSFLMRDRINGDEVHDRFATFMERPTPSKGRTAGTRTFRLVLPNAGASVLYGASN